MGGVCIYTAGMTVPNSTLDCNTCTLVEYVASRLFGAGILSIIRSDGSSLLPLSMENGVLSLTVTPSSLLISLASGKGGSNTLEGVPVCRGVAYMWRNMVAIGDRGVI